MLEQFLKLFGCPLVKFLEDVKGIQKKRGDKFNWSTKCKLDIALEVNKTQPYGLFFTPNGNYDDISKLGDKAICGAAKPGHAPFWNCLFADIDRNNKKNPTGMETNEELWVEVVDTINRHGIPPTFVVETPGGFHLYWLFHPEDRELIHHTMAGDITKILKYVTNLFVGGDDSALAVNKVMRLPFSNHRKTKEPLPVKLKKYNNGVLEDFKQEDFDGLIFMRLKGLENALEYVKGQKTVEATNKVQQQFYSSDAYHTANSIPFPTLLNKLSKFPKLYKGKKYIFGSSGTGITVSIDGGPEELTGGYKRRRDQNYVNCFSDSNHPIEERPRGDIMSFLHYYFSRDAAKVKSFLKNEFMIEVDEAPLEDETEILVITKHDYSIIFTSRRVQLKHVVQGKNQSYERMVDLFKQPLTILGKGKTRMTYNMAETEDLNDVFLCESGINKFFLKRHTTKRDFNSKNSNLFFYGEDNDLGMFYEAIIYDPTIISIDILSQSGVYDDCVYVGGNVIYGKTEKFLLPAFEFDMDFKNKQQISVRDFIDGLCEITDDYIAIPAVLETIVLAGMNIWGTKTIYPGMLLTGGTGSGKTVLSFMLKSMIGYSNISRTYSLGSLSPQPLKQYATDYSLLFLEEITSNVQERCEDILRNVLNHNKGGRGTNTGTNVFYDFRSPIFALGERTFKDESINNRFLTLVMSNTQHKGDDGKIQAMSSMTCIDDIYSNYNLHKDNLDSKYDEYTDRIKRDGVNPRIADVRAYIFAINDLFGIGFTYEELFGYMKKNLKNVGYDLDSAVKIGKEHQLKSIIVNGIMSRRVMGTFEATDDYDSYTIMFMEDYYQKNRAILNFMVTQFNSEKERMWMIGTDLVIRISTTKADPTDFVLDKIFRFILKVGKHVFTTVYD